MEFILIVAALILAQSYTPVQAAPSIESCPPDSLLADDVCKCNPESCVKPPCLSFLGIAANGTDIPGSCCPVYECIDCENVTAIDGKCPCAPEAVLNSKNQCECVDVEKHLVNGECVCDPLQCEIPPLCDKKSVAVTIDDGCCKKTICKPCPSDSESTHMESDVIEDLCVCLPCKTECGNNSTVVVKKRGTNMPGNCCDLYECKDLHELKGCNVNDEFYENGKEWLTSDGHQRCKCQNGLSLCSNVDEQPFQLCFKDDKIFRHLENWTKEDGCTFCTCRNGEEQCISHFCEVKESQIQKNYSRPCVSENRVYQHAETWTEKDDCTSCTCVDGESKCTDEMCDKSGGKKSECQPLANCNKTCVNGFKINKKGCEICKCNSIKFPQDILNKYNITMKDLVTILENYVHQRTSTSTTTTTTTTTTSTPMIQSVSTDVPSAIDKIERMFENSLTSTTTEPSIVPTDENSNYWIVAVPVLIVLGVGCLVFIIILVMCIYKSRRKSSLDISHCHYETVHNHNNNNTIKKTEQLL